ncbi:Pycsar system effector family protein [Halalkalibacter alkalisediminis]|uniref:Pycsar system effector family protein n=1 Tax=Halalkalibacter alkalisediminis TaxID=935616 RepID=A0ABV6NK92_9BACI|nr:Pycsar system effector family protein [Halalkalibacter alkalisediminis]
MSEENKLSESEIKEEAVQTLERINFWISNCDTKISFSLAFAGILLGGFFSSGIITGSLNKLMKGLKEIDKDTPYLKIQYLGITTVVLVVFIILMIVSLTYLFRGKKGSIDTGVYNEADLSKDSTLFFGTIQNKSFIAFKNSMIGIKKDELVNDYLSQVYINSKICNRKFTLYNKGVNWLIASTIAFIILNGMFLFL